MRLPGDGWGGTLRIGLSMPQIVALAALDDAARDERFAEQFGTIARALRQTETVA